MCFHAMVDAAYFAMLFLNYTNISVVVTESGSPLKGRSNEPDATIDTTNTYNSNLIKHVLNQTGTPKYPGIAVSTCIYELYNEDMKSGPLSKKNWGLFNANGALKKGKTPDSCHFDGVASISTTDLSMVLYAFFSLI
ncbi:Glucan endo-1,3-beta-glucosidase [Arachis hypogaea]|nr:Glucan endo-1,3-beta-glucosidase [Arachis hypogaea]